MEIAFIILAFIAPFIMILAYRIGLQDGIKVAQGKPLNKVKPIKIEPTEQEKLLNATDNFNPSRKNVKYE